MSVLRTRDEYLNDAANIHKAMCDRWESYRRGDIVSIPREDAPLFHAMATMILASVDMADSVAEE